MRKIPKLKNGKQGSGIEDNLLHATNIHMIYFAWCGVLGAPEHSFTEQH